MHRTRREDQMIMDARRIAIIECGRVAKSHGEIKSDQIALLNRRLLSGGAILREEADAMFDLDGGKFKKNADWTQCLVDIVTEHVVWQSRPTGILNAEQAEWLLAQFDKGASISALATLVNILAEADRVPLWFLAAVRGRVARAWPNLEPSPATIAASKAAEMTIISASQF